MEEVLQNDSDTFFLNNLLMSVQFFENYDRDIEHLRQNWYKEFSIEPHNKKCFFADSLFRLVGRYVKFSPRHGVNKNLVFEMHPLRIYISSDNVEAAFDPSALKSYEHGIEPQYQFTVKPAEESENSGCITLVEFRRREAANNRKPYTQPNVNGINAAVHSDKTPQENSSSNYRQKKYNFDEQQSRRVTKTENVMGLHNREMNPKISGRKSSLRFLPCAESTIPVNGFYKFTDQEARLTIRDFRMNSALTVPHEIPIQCFQIEEVKKKINSRRAALQECFSSQKILNAAAFKGYFCDLLMEKLTESLNLNSKDVNESIISDEFIIVNQSGTQFYIAPIITIRDWNNFVVMNKRFRVTGKTTEQVVWPSNYMQKIINLLPCNAVPNAHSQWEENLRHQKMWSLVFPKAEEFLLLHMMHAHVRCYLFVLLLYKSFIEKEINTESFGPKHLMHLLFWRVHKNFFAWPEDRPAETLLNFLKILYKKLQNKSLSDFFITSRNLFACSRSKDLHKAQTLIKKIIENPVLYISRAIGNLKLEADYYPAFDVVKLITALNLVHTPVTPKTIRKEKKKGVHFQEDKELLWKKIAIRRIEVEKKLQEQEQLSRLSTESIEVQEKSDYKSQDLRKCNQILEIFTSHFIQMGIKSLGYNFIRQALFYLSQTEKVLELMVNNEIDKDNLNPTIKRINELKETCNIKLKKDFPKFSSKQFEGTSEKRLKNLGVFHTDDKIIYKHYVSRQMNQQSKETINSNEKEFDLDEDNEIVNVKL